MYVNDRLGDFLTRIRNAQMREKTTLELPASKMLISVAKVLKDEGFINDLEVTDTKPQKTLKLELKRVNGEASIHDTKRVSKPGVRRYIGYKDIPRIRRGMGITILSTPKGVMTGEKAKAAKVGGEFLCIVY